MYLVGIEWLPEHDTILDVIERVADDEGDCILVALILTHLRDLDGVVTAAREALSDEPVGPSTHRVPGQKREVSLDTAAAAANADVECPDGNERKFSPLAKPRNSE